MPLTVKSVDVSLEVVMFHHNGKFLDESIVFIAEFDFFLSKDFIDSRVTAMIVRYIF